MHKLSSLYLDLGRSYIRQHLPNPGGIFPSSLAQASRLTVPVLQGQAYWRRERELCSRMLAAAKAGAVGRAGGQPGFSVEDVHAASGGKSFDYRARPMPFAPPCPGVPENRRIQNLPPSKLPLLHLSHSICPPRQNGTM